MAGGNLLGHSAVLVDLGRGQHRELDQPSDVASRCSAGHAESPVARSAGPGFIQLTAGDEPWLLDVVGRRLSRSHAADRRFLPATAWLAVRAVTVGAAAVGATTDAGDRIVVYRST
jgi:hypothetical protein